jgi:hypothetical protein
VKIQRDGYSCAAAVGANLIRAVTGRRVRVAEVAKHAGVTPQHGASEHGLKQALERFGLAHAELIAPFPEAYEILRAHLEGGNPAALLVEVGDHWTAALGVLGARTVVLDGQPSARRGDESGLQLYAKDQLRRHWTAQPSRDGGVGRARFALLVRAT